MSKVKIELNVDSRLSELFQYEEAKLIFDELFPGIREKAVDQPVTLGFSIRKLVSYTGGNTSVEFMDQINGRLSELSIYTSSAENQGYHFDYPKLEAASEVVKEEPRQAIHPGQVWRDTNGVRIQTHGGALFHENDTYYWYGENKDRTDGTCAVWTWGIRAYESKDLYNWKDLGLIIEPDLDNPLSNLYPEKHVDRPHILKCEATGKYVCWIKQSGEEACFLILESDAFKGPYTIIAENYRPFGMKVGDFDIYKESEDEKAYLFMDADHKGIIGLTLSDDYRSAERKISWQYRDLHAPFCREAVAVFKRKEKYYMLTSGMSGYVPNKSDAAIADTVEDVFQSIGDPHVRDESRASFNSQISQVFKVPGKKDCYIALADRWVPEYPVDAKRADLIERSIASHYEPEKYQVTAEEQKEVLNSPMLESANTSIADYVWLPITFEDDTVRIEWHDTWRIEDYE
ncbi:MAG: family 43 glycosylhydrolase [Suipraeoptans sp.]